jgi:hypothetical protein
MAQVFKILIATFTALVGLFFLTTMISIFTTISDAISAALSVPFAIIVGWSVWKSASRRRIGVGFVVLSVALIFGGLGLSIGFLGPMLFDLDANQGPMLGIFITGPLGFVLGAIIGYIYWLRKLKNEEAPNST